jgi:hypothetical protein
MRHPDAGASVLRIAGLGSARAAREDEIAAAGVVLPAAQRAAWMRVHGYPDSLLLVALDADRQPLHALGASITQSRLMPGHRIIRVERLGAGVSAELDRELLGELAQFARGDALALRVVVEVFERDDSARARLGATLAALGFRRAAAPRMYQRTLALDLSGTEDLLFATIDKTARRHVRAPAKKGLEIRTVSSPSLAPRIAVLLEASFNRSRGTAGHFPWARIIAWSNAAPGTSRVVGLFDPRVEGEDSLVSMAWACRHADYAVYEAGASIRRPDLGSTPLGYAPLWDLIAWAQRNNTSWFDLGGASAGDESDGSAGILEFKQHFSRRLLDVGEEWFLEPHPVRAAIARSLSAVAGRLDRLRRGKR